MPDEDQVERYPNNKWFVGYFFSNLAGGLTNPLMTLFVVIYLGLGVFYVGIASALASAAAVPALIFWGNLSDRIRKRKAFILIGFYGAFASLLLILLVHNIWAYLAVMMIFQIVVMASVPVSTLIIVENSTEKAWPGAISKFNGISALGTIAGLIAGSAMILLIIGEIPSNLPMFYVLAGAVYAIASLSVSLTVPEPRSNIPRRKLWKINSIRVFEKVRYFPNAVIHVISKSENGGKPLTADLKRYLLSTTFLMFGFQIFFVAFPVFVLERLGASQADIFILYLANAIGSAVGYRFAGNLSSRYGDRKMTAIALAIRIILFLAMGIMAFTITSYVDVWIAVVVYGVLGGLWSFIGLGQITGVSRLAGKALRGKAIGYYNSLNGVAQIIAGVGAGLIAFYLGYGPDFIIAAIIVLTGSGLALRLTAGKRISHAIAQAANP